MRANCIGTDFATTVQQAHRMISKRLTYQGELIRMVAGQRDIIVQEGEEQQQDGGFATVKMVKSVERKAADWLFGQESNTVALYLILIAMGWCGWYGITVAVPKHLDSIKAGYKEVAADSATAIKELSASNKEAIKEAAEAHSKACSNNIQAFERTIDRLETAYQIERDRRRPIAPSPTP